MAKTALMSNKTTNMFCLIYRSEKETINATLLRGSIHVIKSRIPLVTLHISPKNSSILRSLMSSQIVISVSGLEVIDEDDTQHSYIMHRHTYQCGEENSICVVLVNEIRCTKRLSTAYTGSPYHTQYRHK